VSWASPLMSSNPFTGNGDIVSSTLLRHALTQGNVEKASELLGYPFYVRAVGGPRAELGGKMGFPTANQEIPPGQALPANGVYVTVTHIGDRTYPSLPISAHAQHLATIQEVLRPMS